MMEMMDKYANAELTIGVMPMGGYVVYRPTDTRGMPYQFLYACTTIEFALNFVQQNLKVVNNEANACSKD